MKYSIKSCAAVFMLLLISGTTIVSSDITSSTGKLHDHYDSSAYHSTLFRDKTISLNIIFVRCRVGTILTCIGYVM